MTPSPGWSISGVASRDGHVAISAHLAACASGRELLAAGFGRDVELAAETDAARVVPLLDGDVFTDRAQDV